ncbi:MAG: hypothetical protein ACFFAS_06910 [Promethearchaeota archaeon]
MGGLKVWSNDDNMGGNRSNKSVIIFTIICTIIVFACIALFKFEVITGDLYRWIFFGACVLISIFVSIILAISACLNTINTTDKFEYISYVVLGIVALYFIYDAMFEVFLMSYLIVIEDYRVFDYMIALVSIILACIICIFRGLKGK